MLKNNYFIMIIVMFFGVFVNPVHAQICYTFTDMATENGCIINAEKSYKNWGFVRVKVKGLNSTKPSLDSLLHVVGPYNPPLLQSEYSETVFNKLKPLQEKHGFTIVYYEFSEINEYSLQDKAFSLMAAMQKLDQLRGYTRPSIMMGLSLGGVVARYALTTLESEDYQHGVTHYISFDSPHQGAHVPLAMQEALRFIPAAVRAAEDDNDDFGGSFYREIGRFLDNFFNSDSLSEIFSNGDEQLAQAKLGAADAASLLENQINSIAAKQLLIHNMYADNQRSSESYSLLGELTSLGMPKGGLLATNNIGVVRGSLSGKLFSPDHPFFFDWVSKKEDHTRFLLQLSVMGADMRYFEFLGVRGYKTGIFLGKLTYPDASSNTIGDNGEDTYVHDINMLHTEATSPAPYDLMACSVVELPYLMESMIKYQFSGKFGDFFNSFSALQKTNCFIPSVSALAIPSISPRTNRTDLVSLSPFREVFGQSQNSYHDVIDFTNCSLRKNGVSNSFCFWDAFKGYAEQSYSNVFWGYDNVNKKRIAVNTERLIPIFYLLM